MRAADLIVISAVPVSTGNARNVEAALEMAAAGTPVWADAGVQQTDFAGVTAGLAEAGVRLFGGEAELLATLLERSASAPA